MKHQKRTAGTLPAPQEHATPQLYGLPSEPDLSEHAFAWYAFAPQSEASAPGQAREGLSIKPRTGANQLTGANSITLPMQMFAWQSLTTEEKIPYTFQRPLEGGGLAFATDNDDWADFDINYKANWGLDENISRTFEDTGYRVSDLIWLDEPSVFHEDIVNGESELTFDHFDAEANDDIKRVLIETGAVEVGIAAEQSLPDDTGTGEFTNYNEWCQYNDTDPYQANHVVTIVGWDDDYPASNFVGSASSEPAGNGAWLVKNSWGSAQMYAADTGYHSYWGSPWGLPLSDGNIDPDKNGSGFFWVSYYDRSLGNFASWHVTPIEESYDFNHQYDYLGWAEAGLIPNSEEPAAAANVFTSEGPELLRATTLFTMYAPVAATVRVYFLDDGDEVPTDGKLAAEESFVLEQPGCRTLELREPVKLPAGQRYAVVEEIAREDEEGPLWDINVKLSMDDGSGPVFGEESDDGEPVAAYWSCAVANPGETYLYDKGSWITPAELSKALSGETGIGLTVGNALVKAYTDTDPNPDPVPEPAPEPEPGSKPGSESGSASEPEPDPKLDSDGDDKAPSGLIGGNQSPSSEIGKSKTPLAETGDGTIDPLLAASLGALAIGIGVWAQRQRRGN